MSDKTKLYNEYIWDAYSIDATFRLIKTATTDLRVAYLLGQLSKDMARIYQYYCEISDDVDEEIANYWESYDKLYHSLFKNNEN